MGSVQADVGPALLGQEHQVEEYPSCCCCDQGLDLAGTDRVDSSKATPGAIEHLIAALRRCCRILHMHPSSGPKQQEITVTELVPSARC
jgi:hypothetical protein